MLAQPESSVITRHSGTPPASILGGGVGPRHSSEPPTGFHVQKLKGFAELRGVKVGSLWCVLVCGPCSSGLMVWQLVSRSKSLSWLGLKIPLCFLFRNFGIASPILVSEAVVCSSGSRVSDGIQLGIYFRADLKKLN